MLHGGRFRSRDQTLSECGDNLQFGENFAPNSGKIQGFFLLIWTLPQIRVEHKKRSLP